MVGKHSDLCREVKNQSRAYGAAIKQSKCTGASHQLWSIESTSRKTTTNSFIRRKKANYACRDRPFESEVVVTIDEAHLRPICRSTEGDWIGVVAEQGYTGDGGRATSASLDPIVRPERNNNVTPFC